LNAGDRRKREALASKPFIPDRVFCRLVVEVIAADMKMLAPMIERIPAGAVDERRLRARLLAVLVAYEYEKSTELCYPPMADLFAIPLTSVPMLVAEAQRRRLGKDTFPAEFERVMKLVRAKMAAVAAAA
jgi:hypothetical protein